jgi:hypothetical protein
LPPPAKAGVLKSTIDSIEAGRFDKGISSRMERILRGDHVHAFRRLAYNVKNLGLKNWVLCSAINLADMILKPFIRRHIFDVSDKFFPVDP